MTRSNEDKRRHPRSKTGFPGVRAAADDGILNHVDNISCSGVLCHTNRAVPVMTKMSIVLELPAPFGDRIEAEGIVVRCDPEVIREHEFNVAILFNNLDDGAYHTIKAYVDHDLSQKA